MLRAAELAFDWLAARQRPAAATRKSEQRNPQTGNSPARRAQYHETGLSSTARACTLHGCPKKLYMDVLQRWTLAAVHRMAPGSGSSPSHQSLQHPQCQPPRRRNPSPPPTPPSRTSTACASTFPRGRLPGRGPHAPCQWPADGYSTAKAPRYHQLHQPRSLVSHEPPRRPPRRRPPRPGHHRRPRRRHRQGLRVPLHLCRPPRPVALGAVRDVHRQVQPVVLPDHRQRPLPPGQRRRPRQRLPTSAPRLQPAHRLGLLPMRDRGEEITECAYMQADMLLFLMPLNRAPVTPAVPA